MTKSAPTSPLRNLKGAGLTLCVLILGAASVQRCKESPAPKRAPSTLGEPASKVKTAVRNRKAKTLELRHRILALVGSDGNPAADVSVSEKTPKGHRELGVSDASGFVDVLLLPSPGNEIIFSGPGISQTKITWNEKLSWPVLAWVPRQFSLTVKVTGSDTKRREKATLYIQKGFGNGTRIEMDGSGQVNLPDQGEGYYQFWATRGSQVTGLKSLLLDSNQELSLELTSGKQVSGTLSAPGIATLRLSPESLEHAPREVRANASGEFNFGAVALGRWRLDAWADDAYLPQAFELELTSSSPPVNLRVELSRGVELTGHVRSTSGQAIGGALVTLKSQQHERRIPEYGAGIAGWVHPLAGRRLMPQSSARRFGAKRPGNRPPECGLGHCGVDIGSERGANVHAVRGGTLRQLQDVDRGRAGRYVVLEHASGWSSSYVHLDAIRQGLRVGQEVRAGDPIGILGRSGIKRSKAHLHFGLSLMLQGRRRYIDPEPMLGGAVVMSDEKASVRSALEVDRLARPLDEESATRLERFGDRTTGDLTTRSADDGSFIFKGVRPGTLSLVAEHPDWATAESETLKVSATQSDLQIVMGRGVRGLGRVMGAFGPVAGAQIIAQMGDDDAAIELAPITSDTEGYFELPALAESFTIRVSARGFASAQKRFKRPARDLGTVTLVRENAALLAYFVTPSGQSSGPVSVQLLDGPSGRGQRYESDASGHLRISNLAPGSYTLQLQSPRIPVSRITLKTGDAWRSLTLKEGSGTRVTLSDAHTRRGIPGALVSATRQGEQRVRCTSDSGGTCSLGPMVRGRWSLAVRAKGYQDLQRVVTINSPMRRGEWTASETVELRQGATLAGILRDQYGNRIEGARLSIGSQSSLTDRDGQFSLSDVPTGKVSLLVTKANDSGTHPLDLSPGDRRLTLELTLKRSNI